MNGAQDVAGYRAPKGGGGRPMRKMDALQNSAESRFILRWAAVTPVNMIGTNGCQINVNAGRGEGLG